MAFDDLPLTRTGPPAAPAPKPPASPTRWIVVGAAVVVVGCLLVLWWMVRSRPETATPPPTTATDAAIRTHRPNRQPIELPSLSASDTLLREMARALSHHPQFARLIGTAGLVRAAVLGVQQIGDGKTPMDSLRVLQPATHVTILGTDVGRLDPASYARWNAATAGLMSVNPNAAAQLYVNFKPLFDEAYRDLGHPAGDFDEAIVHAIQTLAATPTPPGDIQLLRRPGYLDHADPALQSALPVQKQFLLVGPENRDKIMRWLKEFAGDLDLKID